MRHKNITDPKNSTRIIFEDTVARFEFPEFISNNYPIPSVFVWVGWHYLPKTPVFAELFYYRYPILKYSELIGWCFRGKWLSHWHFSKLNCRKLIKQKVKNTPKVPWKSPVQNRTLPSWTGVSLEKLGSKQSEPLRTNSVNIYVEDT